ncbi:hypothetical protein FRC09_000866 [Ceratobasidium sp. 395]|nr:hypothetical protein FRC09_000866 [Ceratobasidium sp. 395]
MFFDCKADYVACALLSRFNTVTKQERDVVQYILELIPCYDTVTGRLRMTRDAHILAQIYLAELRTLAGWHSYVHEGSLEDPAQARALLSVVVIPLIRHLSLDEYEDILESMHVAEALLSVDITTLDKLMEHWKSSHVELMNGWRTHPTDGGEAWYYGYTQSVPFRIEDIAKALPYPLKEEQWKADGTEDNDEQQYDMVDNQADEEVNGKGKIRRKLRKGLGRRETDKLEGDKIIVAEAGEITHITLPLIGEIASSSSWSSTESKMWIISDEEEPKGEIPRTMKAKGGVRRGLKRFWGLGQKPVL